MTRVRIIGGGMTGILAAFQAHRLGVRDIDLHERFDELGGIALPERHGDKEIRDGCIYFGPEGDPIRALLEAHGCQFEEFDNRFGSVGLGSDGPLLLDDFGGPALDSAAIDLAPLEGRTLADRLACYDESMAGPLARYVEWHSGETPAALHEAACIPMAINRIFPAKADLEALAEAKREDALANELFGIPRSLWGYSQNAKASVPKGGFAQLFRQCRSALEQIGVRIHDSNLATPKKVLTETGPDEVLVWAASPMPLFKQAGIPTPKDTPRKFATYTFEVEWTGPAPFYVQSFTAKGACWRVYLYPSGGSILLTAECVAEVAVDDLVREMHAMLEGFEGDLTVGELLHSAVKPRWLFHSVETIDALGELRIALKNRTGGRFVTGAWEVYAKGEKYRDVEEELRAALAVEPTRKAS